MARKCESMDRAPIDPHSESAVRDIDAAVDAGRETVHLKRLWDSHLYSGDDHFEAKWRVNRRGVPFVRRWRPLQIFGLCAAIFSLLLIVTFVYFAEGDGLVARYSVVLDLDRGGPTGGTVALHIWALMGLVFLPMAGVAVVSAASPVVIELRRLIPRRRRECYQPEIMFAKRLNPKAKRPEDRVYYLMCFGDSGTPLMILARGKDPERIIAAAQNLPEQIRETSAFSVLRNPVRYHGL